MSIIRKLVKGLAVDSGPQLDQRTFAGYRDKVIRYIARNFRSHPQDVEDLCQKVYLELLKRDDLTGIQKPLPFIYGVASKVLADHCDETATEQARFISEEEVDPASEGFATQSQSAEDFLAIQEQIDKALALLPPMQAAVILAHERDGLTYKEVAAKLGITVDAVHKNLTRARLKIRTHHCRK